MPTPTPTVGSWDLPSGVGGGVRCPPPPGHTCRDLPADMSPNPALPPPPLTCLLTLWLQLTHAWTIFLECTSEWLPLPSKILPWCPEFSQGQVQLLGSALRALGSVATVCLCVPLHVTTSGLCSCRSRVVPKLPILFPPPTMPFQLSTFSLLLCTVQMQSGRLPRGGAAGAALSHPH